MTYIDFAEKVISEEKKPLSITEIWEIGSKKGYNNELSSIGKTPWATLGARVYVEIRDNSKTNLYKVKSKPVKFYLKNMEDAATYQNTFIEIEDKINIFEKKNKYSERDLHKLLTYYLDSYHNILSKSIYHEESNKKQFSQWLHPDLVGVYYSMEQVEPEVFDLYKEVGVSSIKLFSYEMKKELNFSNIREAFFQSVSNSSWANEGYLVAAEIDQDEDFLDELKRLALSFGIGIIKLDIRDPDSSYILYNAKYRDVIDIDTVNKITEVNPNFREFIKRIKTDLSSHEIRREKYEKVLTVEELIKSYP